MMPRKRSRAAGSSRAGPCSVSMKPVSAASGVRSSWLALATKSARISSTRRIGVRSWTRDDDDAACRLAAASATGDDERLGEARRRHRVGKFDALRLAGPASHRGSPRPVPACAARSRPARRGAAPARCAAASALKAMHAAVLIEHDDRIGQPGNHGVEQRDGRAMRRARRRPAPRARRARSSARAPSSRLSRPIQPRRRRHPPPTSRRLCKTAA